MEDDSPPGGSARYRGWLGREPIRFCLERFAFGRVSGRRAAKRLIRRYALARVPATHAQDAVLSVKMRLTPQPDPHMQYWQGVAGTVTLIIVSRWVGGG